VCDFAFENDGDNLHFFMRMGAKASLRLHHVVIDHPQGAKLDIVGGVVVGERKQPIGLQPVIIRKVPLRCPNNPDHMPFLQRVCSSSGAAGRQQRDRNTNQFAHDKCAAHNISHHMKNANRHAAL
jgi:hypothetical protein